MTRLRSWCHVLIVALTLAAPFADARSQTETVEADLSARDIVIESDFTGAEIVIFGSVDGSKQAASTSGYYDIIMVIRGPAQTVIARKKERIAGVWINGESEAFADVSSFYAVLSTRPLNAIASKETLRRFGIEFDPNLVARNGTVTAQEFEDAVKRIKQKQELYVEKPFAVEFLGRSLFRGTVKLPAKVVEGRYTAKIYLLRQGQLLSRDDTTLTVTKEGIERLLDTMAFDRPWLYGILSVLLAVACGFLGWTLFSRGN